MLSLDLFAKSKADLKINLHLSENSFINLSICMTYLIIIYIYDH